ncbi:MAG: exosortase/archaeosortase family protein [Candidatus Azobacteroides sp.]|nr:exosortase/archaeosortase family protein [Candidatus Azobacteroides sp.]
MSFASVWRTIAPYKGVIYFLGLLFFFHVSWKLTIEGDRDSEYMYFLGKNVTPAWFHTACFYLTQATAWFILLLPKTQSLIVDDTTLFFPNGGIHIFIIWGCIGIKQLFIFCGIMTFYRLTLKGKFQWNKLWYIPLGCIVLTIYNIIRIGLIVVLTNGHSERFDSLHDGIFRYIYYLIIFIFWVVWEEVYVKRAEEEKQLLEEKQAEEKQIATQSE